MREISLALTQQGYKKEGIKQKIKCRQWIQRFSNRDNGYQIQEFLAQIVKNL